MLKDGRRQALAADTHLSHGTGGATGLVSGSSRVELASGTDGVDFLVGPSRLSLRN